ncbi:putative type IV pilin [Aliivibrio wodanis]|uniref:Putative type IV pilin n=1 Tax=Aliivibrio wodanis TaxID=80852 RepID=A0A090IQS1_9GAMM|nr:putative type IV pilin [Aliivibrio wodanis]VVV03225.1 hypothetical protein AW0309160_00593 [Aliivibrio wodanis]
MPRGFTLFELVLTTAVISILLMAAAPNFSRLIEQQEIKRLSGEVEGFFIQAKSESVLQNKSLKVFYIVESNDWIISLNPEGSTIGSIADIKLSSLSYIQSQDYPNLFISSSVLSLTFNPVRATPHMPASFLIYKNTNEKLKLSIHNITGRITVCGEGGVYYDFKSC